VTGKVASSLSFFWFQKEGKQGEVTALPAAEAVDKF